jgi:pimeloyl-ACP methyl ester carboxylesterase
MAPIVLIHGAFNELWGPNELKARWLPAVQDGLWHEGRTIAADDVDVCFYGDLFRLDLATLDVEQWKTSRAGAEDMLATMGGESGLDFLEQAAGQATYDRTVDMVTIMAGDPTLSATIRERLLYRIGPDTRAVVAHSLGTVIAYNALLAHPEVEVDTLITLGSPLGSDLVPTEDGTEPGTWPGAVGRWVNIVAHSDHVAYPSRVADRFGDRVEEHVVDNGHRGHDPEPYLNSRPAGAALARALEGPRTPGVPTGRIGS